MSDVDRHRTRIQQMVTAIEDADAERALAMFRAYECDLPVEEIARLAMIGVDGTRDIIRQYATDPDAAGYRPFGRWVTY